MSDFLELYTELSAAELIAVLEGGLLEPVKFTPGESLGPDSCFYWENGRIIVANPSAAGKEIITESTRMTNPCSELYFSPSGPQGYADVLRITAGLLSKLGGDMILVHYGGSVTLERIDGRLALSSSGIVEKYRRFFRPPYNLVEFPPLP